jgi:hypothetical protein
MGANMTKTEAKTKIAQFKKQIRDAYKIAKAKERAADIAYFHAYKLENIMFTIINKYKDGDYK